MSALNPVIKHDNYNELNLNALQPVAKQTNKTFFLSKIIAIKRIKNFQRDITCKNYRTNAQI